MNQHDPAVLRIEFVPGAIEVRELEAGPCLSRGEPQLTRSGIREVTRACAVLVGSERRGRQRHQQQRRHADCPGQPASHLSCRAPSLGSAAVAHRAAGLTGAASARQSEWRWLRWQRIGPSNRARPCCPLPAWWGRGPWRSRGGPARNLSSGRTEMSPCASRRRRPTIPSIRRCREPCRTRDPSRGRSRLAPGRLLTVRLRLGRGLCNHPRGRR